MTGTASRRPTLYIDFLAAFFVEKASGLEVAPFARQFLAAVKGRFRIRCLSEIPEAQALTITRSLGFDADYVHWSRNLGKAKVIDMNEPFYWIEADPSPSDLLRLSDARCSERLIPIVRREGVTEATLKKLEMTFDASAG